jgi:nucleolar GTP-binding protein
MATPFERIPTVPEADEVLDDSFAKASRVSETSSGVESQQGMTVKASNLLQSRLTHVVEGFPSFDRLEGFYLAVAVAAIDIDEVRQALSSVDWAAGQVERIADEAQSDMTGASSGEAMRVRKRAFARMSSVIGDVEKDLTVLRDARGNLIHIPEVKDLPTAVLAGAPNVGKSALLESLTRAKPEVAPYAFTTKGIGMGHIEEKDGHRSYQVIDTPGLLDRHRKKRNEMEEQAVEALEHLAGVVVFVVDPTETCGYTLEKQRALLGDVRSLVDSPFLIVANKSDMRDEYVSDTEETDLYVSAESEQGTEQLRGAVIRELTSEPRQAEKDRGTRK